MRRSMAAVLAAALFVAGACDVARAGTRCRPGGAPGRDATHVLVCDGGRWTRSVTIAAVAEVVVGAMPGSVEVASGSPVATSGGPFTPGIRVRVTNRNGQPSAGATVTLAGPATGPGLAGAAALTATTGTDGVADFGAATAAGPVGGFELTATVVGTDLVVVFAARTMPVPPPGAG